MHSILPLLIAVPVMVVLVLIVIRRSLAPLDDLASDVGEREANYLSPVVIRRLPKELQTVVDALNGLFDRLIRAFDRESRFAADAAHELRTPLSALSIHAQNAQNAQDEKQRADSMKKMQIGLERTTHVVEQLLALCRVEPTAASGEWEDVDLSAIVNRVMSELQDLADSKSMNLICNLEAHTMVRGNRTLLSLLVRNVLDNALRYTPSGGRIRLNVETEE